MLFSPRARRRLGPKSSSVSTADRSMRCSTTDGRAGAYDAMYALLVALVSVTFCTCLVYLGRQLHRPKNYPPGPLWIPILGNLFTIQNILKKVKYQHEVFNYLSRKYNTSVLGLKMGKNLTVVVSGINLIHQVMTKEEFEGRPDSFFIRLRCMGTKKGITCTDGKLWHEQRAFVLRHLRRLGYGSYSMESVLRMELSDLRKHFCNSNAIDGVRLSPLLATAVLNVLWTLVAGARLSSSKFYLNKMLELLEQRTQVFDMSGGLLNHLPWIRFIAPASTGYNLITNINKELRIMFKEIIDEHLSTYDSHQTRDLVDAFLHEMKLDDTKSELNYSADEDQLIMVCLDLFIAGSQTTSNTLDFALLLMVLHPEIQKKVQAEIFSVIGSECLPTLEKRSQMPYVEAVLMEVQRLCQVTPVAGPRRVMKDTTLNGYMLPKDTSILINLHSVHMDQSHWGDPEVFRPERFLEKDGNLKAGEHIIPFGLGRRRCLGEALARSCIFIFFTGILQHYNISPAPGEDILEIKPIPGITMAPQIYHAVLSPIDRSF